MNNKTLLEWYIAAGVDEAVDNAPTNYFALKPQLSIITPSPSPSSPPKISTASTATPLHLAPAAASNAARELANNCKTVAELEETVRKFDGCAIKKTATKTVFADGNPQAQIMIIGDAPDASEDVSGSPFSGENGILLNKMLGAIGLDRTSTYLTNMVFWRPAGNRQASEIEITTCLPFVEKHIALVSPKLLILSGGIATTALLHKDQSISRLRGKFYDYKNDYLSEPIQTILMYHPSYLLKQPLHKKQAWQDLIMIKKFMCI